MPECLAEVLVVVVAGDGQDCAAAAEERLERRLQVTDGLTQRVRPGQLAEDVAGNQQDIDLFGQTVFGDTFDAVVVEVDEEQPTRGELTVPEPAVEARVVGPAELPLGQPVKARLAGADVRSRTVEFTLE